MNLTDDLDNDQSLLKELISMIDKIKILLALLRGR